MDASNEKQNKLADKNYRALVAISEDNRQIQIRQKESKEDEHDSEDEITANAFASH